MRYYFNFFFSLGLGCLLLLSSCKVKDYASDARPIVHATWDSLLQKYVGENGLVDYEGFIKDSVKFNSYLNVLKNNHPNPDSWTKEERLAYWINAYNAFTVKIVIDNYPTPSIKKIKPGIPFVNSVWDIKFIEIEGQTYDLNNIEHGILRAKFEEPRIHFAVNCASISCPKLLNRAYEPYTLEEQLNAVAKDFLTDELRNIIQKDKVQLSKIFFWYRGDFVKNMKLIEFINQYASIKVSENAKVSYLSYDWNLNVASSE